MGLRRESGAVEEISVDAIRITGNDVHAALDSHGLSRLLLHTRALLSQSMTEAEKWLSADDQVTAELRNFSQLFKSPRARSFGRELEKEAKSFQPEESRPLSLEARQFLRFRVKHFRNLENLEVVTDHADGNKAQAIVLFGPNGTGKSSFAEALSLAAFNTSPRLEQFMGDPDLLRLRRQTAETYLNDYLTPLSSFNAKPCFAWDKDGKYEETPFVLNPDDESRRRFEGVVLNQEDSLNFTEIPREKLASLVLKGYSTLADHLSSWLEKQENRAKETKSAFTRSKVCGVVHSKVQPHTKEVQVS
jgi:energy-coupling factor transporter ATP-binding protein EcfA2